MAYITTPGFAGVDLTETGTDQLFDLGIEVQASDGNTYKYVKGGMTSQFPYIFREDGTSVIASTSNSGATPNMIVIPQQGIDTDYYGWAVCKGLDLEVQVQPNAAADVKIYTATTRLDDDPSGTDLVQGLRLNATNGGGTAAINATACGILETNSQD